MPKLDLFLSTKDGDEVKVKTSKDVMPNEINSIVAVMKTILYGAISRAANTQTNDIQETEEEKEEEISEDEYDINASKIGCEGELIRRLSRTRIADTIDSTIPPGATPLSQVIDIDASDDDRYDNWKRSNATSNKGWSEGGYGNQNWKNYGNSNYNYYSGVDHFGTTEVKKEDVSLPSFQNNSEGETGVRMRIVHCESKLTACKILKEVLGIGILSCKQILESKIPCPEMTIDKAAELYGKLQFSQCFVSIKEVDE